MSRFEIVNIVVTADLKQNVDLRLVGPLNFVEYNQRKYGGRVAYFKTKQMDGKVSLFKSGKMISIGSKSLKRAIQDLDFVRKTLEKSRLITPVILMPAIRNIVFSVKYDLDLDLETLAKQPNIIYEPEQFPGAIIRIEQPNKAVVLLFASGKAVVVGLKDPQQIHEVNAKIIRLIKGKDTS